MNSISCTLICNGYSERSDVAHIVAQYQVKLVSGYRFELKEIISSESGRLKSTGDSKT